MIDIRPTDQYGELIQPGDIISYPIRKGKDFSMRTARVKSIESVANWLGGHTLVLKIATFVDGRIKNTTLRSIGRVTIIPKYKIQGGRYGDLLQIQDAI